MSDTSAKPLPDPSADARPRTTPPGWAEDELTKFLQVTHEQQYATFHNKKEVVSRLVAIDALFVRVSIHLQSVSSLLEPLLFLRSHGAFRGAVGEAMSGQVVECYRQCRGVLENAAYAVHIHCDPSLATVWLNRHQNDAGMRASKKAFQHIAVSASVAKMNRDAGRRFEELYKRTIDFGGHPNQLSVTTNMSIVDEPGRREMQVVMLHGDGIQLDLALKTVAQCGMVALELLQIPFGAKFDLLGVNVAMVDLRSRL